MELFLGMSKNYTPKHTHTKQLKNAGSETNYVPLRATGLFSGAFAASFRELESFKPLQVIHGVEITPIR